MRYALLFLILAGCASTRPTLEELEDEALHTGDWSEVEKREGQILHEKRRQQMTEACRQQGALLVCAADVGRDLRDCSCVRYRDIRRVIGGT